MARRKAYLGLHTKEERAKAYGRARREVESAIRSGELFGLWHSHGYLRAILDLAHDEGNDPEFISALEELQVGLEHAIQERVNS